MNTKTQSRSALSPDVREYQVGRKKETTYFVRNVLAHPLEPKARSTLRKSVLHLSQKCCFCDRNNFLIKDRLPLMLDTAE